MDWSIICFHAATFIAAVVLLDIGADKFVDHTAIIARRLGVSATLIALLTAGAEWEEVSRSPAQNSDIRSSLIVDCCSLP